MRRTEDQEPVEVAVSRFIRETPKALLVEVTDTGEETWFPRSQVEGVDRMDDGAGILTVSRWLAVQKELVEE